MRPPQISLLENTRLGVHHGHTTAVLGAIFQRVIAVDVLRQSLDIAASHTRELSNVFMLLGGHYSPFWSSLFWHVHADLSLTGYSMASCFLVQAMIRVPL